MLSRTPPTILCSFLERPPRLADNGRLDALCWPRCCWSCCRPASHHRTTPRAVNTPGWSSRATRNSVASTPVSPLLISVPARRIYEGAAPCPYCLAPCPNSLAPRQIYMRLAPFPNWVKKIKAIFTYNLCFCVFRQLMNCTMLADLCPCFHRSPTKLCPVTFSFHQKPKLSLNFEVYWCAYFVRVPSGDRRDDSASDSDSADGDVLRRQGMASRSAEEATGHRARYGCIFWLHFYCTLIPLSFSKTAFNLSVR